MIRTGWANQYETHVISMCIFLPPSACISSLVRVMEGRDESGGRWMARFSTLKVGPPIGSKPTMG